MKFSVDQIAAAVTGRMPFAESLFETLAMATLDGEGVTRPAWSPADRYATSIVSDAACAMGLEVAHDLAGNVYATLPGRDRTAPALLTGSHLDSVPKGGNYDGYAGVIAGLTSLAALRDLGITNHVMATVRHDASIFARAGIPSAMVLVRNQNGSHNAAEAMEMADFDCGTAMLATTLLDLA